jgi:hypothetical protein
MHGRSEADIVPGEAYADFLVCLADDGGDGGFGFTRAVPGR